MLHLNQSDLSINTSHKHGVWKAALKRAWQIAILDRKQPYNGSQLFDTLHELGIADNKRRIIQRARFRRA